MEARCLAYHAIVEQRARAEDLARFGPPPAATTTPAAVSVDVKARVSLVLIPVSVGERVYQIMLGRAS